MTIMVTMPGQARNNSDDMNSLGEMWKVTRDRFCAMCKEENAYMRRSRHPERELAGMRTP